MANEKDTKSVLDKETIQQKLNELKRESGEWTYDIPLPFDIWTRGNLGVPHSRLKRIVQTVHDLVGKPLNECRVLDLGCLDGIFSIEFALHGAQTIGVRSARQTYKKPSSVRKSLIWRNWNFVRMMSGICP